MINNKKILAIIPARGGSKGLPGKNILELKGKPLIAWTIQAAQQSKYIDRIIVSTDDEKIASVAKNWNCEVPFMRPPELASDTAGSLPVISHAIEQLGFEGDIIVLLQPTSPFRKSSHIDEALEAYDKSQASSMASVTLLNKSPEWLFWIEPESNTLCKVIKNDTLITRRQDTAQAYYLNGALYIVDKNYFIENHKVIDQYTKAYIMSNHSSLDIDTKEDFIFAQKN